MKKIASIMAALVLMCAFAFAAPQESTAAPDNVGIYLIEDFNSGYEEFASVSKMCIRDRYILKNKENFDRQNGLSEKAGYQSAPKDKPGV